MISGRISASIIAILFLLLFQACSGTRNPVAPDGTPDRIPDSIGRSVIAIYDATIDPTAKTFDITPSGRTTAFHFPISKIYPDVLSITGYGWTPGFWIDIQISHPFPGSGIDIFDPRVIAIIPASQSHYFHYPAMAVSGNDDVVLNPDSYTKLFDSLDGSMPGNINPFKAYFKDQPNRVWKSIGATQETLRWYLDINGFSGPRTFKLVVDVSTRYPNSSTPIIDNAPEPVQIDIAISDGLTPDGGVARVDAILTDWQGAETIDSVEIEAPSLFNGAVNLTYTGFEHGENEFLYYGYISNFFLAPEGTYNLMIAASDKASGLTIYNEFPFSVKSNFPEIIKTIKFADNLHAHDVNVCGQFAYVTFNNPSNPKNSGLKIIDIYPPELASPVATYVTTTAPIAMDSADNYVYLITSGTFRVISVWPPVMPYAVKTISIYNPFADIGIDSGKAYLTRVTGSTDIYDIEPPEQAAYVGKFMTTSVQGVCVDGFGNFVFEGITNPFGTGDMYIADVQDPASPVLVKTINFPQKVRNIDAINGYVYVCSDSFYIVDVDPPESASIINSIPDFRPEDVFVRDNYAYIIQSRQIVIINIDPPESAYPFRTIKLPNIPADVYASGNYIYVTMNDADGLHGCLAIIGL